MTSRAAISCPPEGHYGAAGDKHAAEAKAFRERHPAHLEHHRAAIAFDRDADRAVLHEERMHVIDVQDERVLKPFAAFFLFHSCGPRWPATPDSNEAHAPVLAQPQFEKPSTVSNVTVKERPESSERTAPPKRWRNKWRARKNTYFDGDSQWAVEGEVWFGSFVWPSREVAEQKAADEIEDDRLYFGDEPIEYLGAFPIEEAA